MLKITKNSPQTKFAPEAQLLLCCAHTSWKPGSEDRLRLLLDQPLDWSYLLHTASLHCVLPLLYWHLKAVDAQHVPPHIWRELEAHSHYNTAHNFCLTRELIKLINLFQEHNIPMVPLKGPVLAASAYGNLSLRQFGDLDILVHKRDIAKAKGLLLSENYSLQVALTDDQEVAHLLEESVYDFIRQDGLVPLELHWGITAPCIPFPLDLDRLEGHLETIPLAGIQVPNIAPEELLLILCVHGTKHIWGRLEWICDVAELVHAYPQLDWERVLEQAQILNVSRMLALGLILAHDVLEMPLPDSIDTWLSSQDAACTLSLQVRHRMFSEDDPSRVEDDFFIMHAIERFPDRLSYLLHLAVTPSAKERAKLRLPAALNFLWYLIRPIRLLVKYTGRGIVLFVNRSIVKRSEGTLRDSHQETHSGSSSPESG